jgi:hypothetical protein
LEENYVKGEFGSKNFTGETLKLVSPYTLNEELPYVFGNLAMAE